MKKTDIRKQARQLKENVNKSIKFLEGFLTGDMQAKRGVTSDTKTLPQIMEEAKDLAKEKLLVASSSDDFNQAHGEMLADYIEFQKLQSKDGYIVYRIIAPSIDNEQLYNEMFYAEYGVGIVNNIDSFEVNDKGIPVNPPKPQVLDRRVKREPYSPHLLTMRYVNGKGWGWYYTDENGNSNWVQLSEKVGFMASAKKYIRKEIKTQLGVTSKELNKIFKIKYTK